jgi:pimeloyl-ACP methyl ester carboxylesterase
MAFAEADDRVKLYWEEHVPHGGGAGASLLMIPGFGCSVEIYGSNTPAFAERFRTIVFDPRGAGRSDSPESGYTMQRYADDCAAVLDAAGCDAAHVFGTSFGGMVALNFALAHPQRVRGLVLACTTPGGSAHVLPPPENLATFMAASLVEDPVESTRMRYPLHYSDDYVRDHDAEIIARSVATAHMRPTDAGRAGQLAAVQSHDVAARLHEIASPSFVAHGSDDGVIPAANADVLAEGIPGASLKIYDGARHIFFVERADEFNADVIAFLSGD